MPVIHRHVRGQDGDDGLPFFVLLHDQVDGFGHRVPEDQQFFQFLLIPCYPGIPGICPHLFQQPRKFLQVVQHCAVVLIVELHVHRAPIVLRQFLEPGESGSAVISTNAADLAPDLQVGAAFSLVTAGGLKTFTVVGTFTSQSVLAVPQFIVTGTKGEFTLFPGAAEGMLRHLDRKQKLPRRRSSVRTPPLGSFGTPETLRWVETQIPVAPKADCGMTLIWDHVFNAIRENKPFPIPLDNAIETMRILTLIKKESAFA